MTEEEAKAAVIMAAERVTDHLFLNGSTVRLVDNEDATIPILKELHRCVAQYRQFQRRVFLVAHGEHANISVAIHNGRITLELPNGEFTTGEEDAMRAFRTAVINDNRLLMQNAAYGTLAHHCAQLLVGFQRLERIGSWPFAG